MTDPLTERLRSLEPDGLEPAAIDPAVVAARGRARRRRRRGAGAVAVIVVAAAVAIPLSTRGGQPAPKEVQVVVATPSVIAGVPTSELVVDGQQPLACGLAPLGVLTEPGGAERADTPEAAGLRYVLAHHIEGAGGSDWVLLDEHDGIVDFGQRTGAVGILATIELKRTDGTYRWAGSGGCGPVGYPDGQSTMPSGGFGVGDHLVIPYTLETCDLRPPTFHLDEHAAAVDVEAVYPAPIPSASGVACGRAAENMPYFVLPLSRPLGRRTVRDVAYLPPRTQTPAEATPTPVMEAGTNLCLAATDRAGLYAVDVVDVATVRADVPAAATAWRSLTSSQTAGDCYVRDGMGTFTELVATSGEAPIEIGRHRTAEQVTDLVRMDGHRPPS